MNPLDLPVPDLEDVAAELQSLRLHGIVGLLPGDYPLLCQCLRASGRIGERDNVGPYAIERMLADAAVRIGGDNSELAAIIFGLSPETRGGEPAALRRVAAETAGVSQQSIRKTREPLLRIELANQVLAEVHDYRLRISRLQMDTRTPIGSRLAVEWLARFEAMYAIWSPVSGIGAELTGYRATLLEEDRPWDQEPDPDVPGDTGYTQEQQAAGYVTDALIHVARFLTKLDDLKTRFGGLWLLPGPQAETDIADAVMRIGRATPNNERDDSLMRIWLRSANGELAHFLDEMSATEYGRRLHDLWQDWADCCDCTWIEGERHGREHFPTALTHPGIDPQCDLHILIAACNDYMLILDDAWDQIADWYHDAPMPNRVDVTAEQIYSQREHPLPRFEQQRRAGE